MTAYNPFQEEPAAQAGPSSAASDPKAATHSSSHSHWTQPSRQPPQRLNIIVTTPGTSSTHPATAAPPPLLSSNAPPPPFYQLLSQNGRRLLHHYTTVLTLPYMGPVFESDITPRMNATIRRRLSGFPYLLNVVLCYSALHLASASPAYSPEQSSHLSMALHYKAKALETFRPAIAGGIHPENGEALLAAAAVFVACALALPGADPGCRTDFNRIDLLAQTAGLYQGNWVITKQGIFGPYANDNNEVQPPDYQSPGADFPWSDAHQSMDKAAEAIDALEEETEDQRHRKAILVHAAAKLRKSAKLVAAATKNFYVICAWMGMVKPEFIDLMKSRDPLALVLTAHWAICRNRSYSEWWAVGWPEAAVASIKAAVSDEYQYLLKWCLDQAQYEGSPVATSTSGSVIKFEDAETPTSLSQYATKPEN